MKTLLKKIFRWVYPELGWLSSSYYDFSKLRSWENNVVRGKHVKVEPIVSLNNVTIGDYTYISSDGHVSNTNIGKFCSIGPNLFCGWGIHPTDGISTSPMFYSINKPNGVTLSNKNKIKERKIITIGNDVFIGANVKILDGVTIGDGAIIGAGAVVSKDIPPYAIAVGNPIRIIRYRMTEDQINHMKKIKWWNWDYEKLNEVEKLFFEIDRFIAQQNMK
jgi:acetyltransferase-like isoleucine patch superfamily enzyme